MSNHGHRSASDLLGHLVHALNESHCYTVTYICLCGNLRYVYSYVDDNVNHKLQIITIIV